jgi:hypothetical protein
MVAPDPVPPPSFARALSTRELQVPVSQISLFEDLLKPIENILISLFHAALPVSGEGRRSPPFDYE